MRNMSNLFFSFVIGYFIVFCIALFSTRLKLVHEDEVLSKMATYFNVKNVNVLKTGTHRKYTPDSDYSGGSSSSHSSSGGGGNRF